MNYIKEAENYLWYYHDLYRSIENLDRQISRLIAKAGPKMSVIKFDETGVKTGHYDDAFNILFEIQKLTEAKQKTLTALNDVEEILEEISVEPGCELYGQVLRKWYIEKVPKDDIAEQLGYSSRRSVYEIKNRAIRKFAVRLFGLEALQVV